MEVSKHYVEDQSNRITFRADVKENEAADSKAKVPAAVRSRGLSFRPVSQKHSSKISASTPGDTSVTNHVGKMKDSSANIVKHSLTGTGSFSSSKAAIGGTSSFSSRVPPSDANISKIAPKSDSLHKGKSASTSGKLANIEDRILSSSQIEPRRSNRQIQPTSRVGLTSLFILGTAGHSS